MPRHVITLRERLPSVAKIAPPGALLAPLSPPPPAQAPIAEQQLRIDALAEALRGVVEAVESQRQMHRAELLEASIELGLAIAEKLVGAAVALDRHRLDLLVLEMLERAQPNKPIVIRANAVDLELLERQLANSTTLEYRQAAMTFRPDDSCARGQLRVETGELFLELDLPRALAEIHATLLEQLFTDE